MADGIALSLYQTVISSSMAVAVTRADGWVCGRRRALRNAVTSAREYVQRLVHPPPVTTFITRLLAGGARTNRLFTGPWRARAGEPHALTRFTAGNRARAAGG